MPDHATTRYVAFLRAINVGGRVVKMDALRKLFEGMGFSGVETFIASGNVIFESGLDAKSLEKRIGDSLRAALGYEVGTMARTTAEVDRIARHNPYPDAELGKPGTSLHVGFMARAFSPQSRRTAMSFVPPGDDFHLHKSELYWLTRTGVGKSEFSLTRLEKALGYIGTFRNVTTVRKLAAKYPPSRTGPAAR
jgi:uncharacterized protein (DUF1697 family)